MTGRDLDKFQKHIYLCCRGVEWTGVAADAAVAPWTFYPCPPDGRIQLCGIKNEEKTIEGSSNSILTTTACSAVGGRFVFIFFRLRGSKFMIYSVKFKKNFGIHDWRLRALNSGSLIGSY